MTSYTTEYLTLASGPDTTTVAQLQNGAMEVSTSGEVFLHTAGPAGRTLGKSALSTRLEPVAETATIIVEMDFLIPEGAPTTSIMLADFESASTGLGTNPGVRVYLRDGQLRVDRTKIGEEATWYSAQKVPIEAGDWSSLRIELEPGGGTDGAMRIWLDGVLVLDEIGSTVLTQAALDPYGLTLSGGEIDRVQLGLTANSNDTEAQVATRDIVISVDDPANGRNQTVTLNPEEVVAGAERHIERFSDPAIAPTEGHSDPSEFGAQVQIGTAGDDRLVAGDWGDELYGGAGDDTLVSGAGDDTLVGGTGADKFVFAADWGHDVIRDYKPGVDRLGFEMTMAEASKLDLAETTAGTFIHDGKNSVLLEGVKANAFLVSDIYLISNPELGPQVQTGTAGNDRLEAGNWGDELYGGAGNDTLVSGAGNDTFVGGTGRDSFVFSTDWGHDVIRDFRPGVDRIGLDMTLAEAGALELAETAAGAVIHDGKNSLLLEGVRESEFVVSDIYLVSDPDLFF